MIRGITELLRGKYGRDFGIKNLTEVSRLLFIHNKDIAQKLSKASTTARAIVIEDLIDVVKGSGFAIARGHALTPEELAELIKVEVPLARRLFKGDKTITNEELLAHGRDRENWDWFGSVIGILLTLSSVPHVQEY